MYSVSRVARRCRSCVSWSIVLFSLLRFAVRERQTAL
jgi:hypothetical protein